MPIMFIILGVGLFSSVIVSFYEKWDAKKTLKNIDEVPQNQAFKTPEVKESH